MTALKEQSGQEGSFPTSYGLPVPIDEMGLSGLSALLTFPPSIPFMQGAEHFMQGGVDRRAGQDRRKGDRRAADREFKNPE